MAEIRRRVSIIHAFSRRNAGDGLLVDLTYEALADAGVRAEDCRLFALDPESFPEFANVRRAPGEPTARLTGRLPGAAGELLASGFGIGNIRRLLDQSDALVAVGGGYLVADSPVRQAGVALNHLAQLRAASLHNGPTVYLPQSIGPLGGIVGRWTRNALAGVGRVWARDDRTVAELGLSNVRRCPDLAVMKLARSLDRAAIAPEGKRIILIGRDLPKAPGYIEKLYALNNALPGCSWAVQADMTGPRSDRSFYQRIGIKDAGALRTLLESSSGPVVSVRLHGAISALIAGNPAIHLAYERKGWGAYEDLGLGEFVHDARNFDPAYVAQQARSLAVNSGPFWAAVRQARTRLSAAWDEMVADLAQRIEGGKRSWSQHSTPCRPSETQ